MTAHGTIPDAVQATQEGVFSYITKPIDKEEFMTAVTKAVEVSGGASLVETKKNDPWKRHIITRSPLMAEIISKAKLVAHSEVRVLLTGESGTGKESLARTIHEASRFSEGPFISVNCSVLTEETLENEVLPRVDGGTLFLNEIADISSSLQVNLMRLLKSYEIELEGKTKHRVRLISSSISDLKDQMNLGKFRDDLYYSLSVVAFNLPNLTSRREDVALLARHFLKDIAEKQGSNVQEFAPEALKQITEAKWPGNVRQLYHVVEQLVALSTTPIIPSSLVEKALDDHDFDMLSFSEARSNFERDYLIRLLKITEGNVSQAARSAKRNRTDFYKLLARNNIEPAMLKRSLFRSTNMA
jgi:two-component system response regulator GlrR